MLLIYIDFGDNKLLKNVSDTDSASNLMRRKTIKEEMKEETKARKSKTTSVIKSLQTMVSYNIQ